MKKYKVSVVVPVYNVEKYLRQCLDSVAEGSEILSDTCLLAGGGCKSIAR